MIKNRIAIESKDLSALSQAQKYLPALSSEEKTFIEELPPVFKIDCPYYKQEKMHYSGAACVQMLAAFHGDPVPNQEDVAWTAGWDNWKFSNHESLSEDLVRHMARRNFVPAIYYPGRHILPNFKVGTDGVDFISGNRDVFEEIDFSYFKALLVNARAPMFVRLHFNTTQYPMPEEMAEKLDHTGHGVLIVGYNEEGFIVNDPWDKESWGGTRGGKDTLITYFQMRHEGPAVNCCLDLVASFTKPQAFFEVPPMAVYQERDLNIDAVIQSIGIPGIQSDIYQLEDISVSLRVHDNLECKSPLKINASASLLPGKEVRVPISIKTGKKTGSFPIYGRIQSVLKIPAFPWEELGKEERITITYDIATRIDVKDKEWLNRYGRY